jgi:hypothetical protein
MDQIIQNTLIRKNPYAKQWTHLEPAKRHWLAALEDGYCDTLLILDNNGQVIRCYQLLKPFTVMNKIPKHAPSQYLRDH